MTGDVTQIDLPAQKVSGLVEAAEVVGGIRGIAVAQFDERDVVRHPLVQRIVKAYDRHEASLRERSADAEQDPPASSPARPPGEKTG